MFRSPHYKAPQRPGRRPPRRVRFSPRRLVPLLVGAALMILAVLAHRNVLPMLKTMSEHQARLVCTQIINDVVAKELDAQDLRYESLVNLTRGEDQSVTAVETNVVAANRLKAAVSAGLVRELERRSMEEIRIPIGTLMNSPLFNGRGPAVPFRIVPSQSAKIDFASQFVSAGINQTQHQILLQITADADAIIPGIRTNVHIETSFLVAETVIVGAVPELYATLPTLSST